MRKNNEGGVPLENKSSLHLSETYIGGETAGGEGMMDYYPPQRAYGCTSAVGNTMPMIEAFTFVLTVCPDFCVCAVHCLWQQSSHILATAALF